MNQNRSLMSFIRLLPYQGRIKEHWTDIPVGGSEHPLDDFLYNEDAMSELLGNVSWTVRKSYTDVPYDSYDDAGAKL